MSRLLTEHEVNKILERKLSKIRVSISDPIAIKTREIGARLSKMETKLDNIFNFLKVHEQDIKNLKKKKNNK